LGWERWEGAALNSVRVGVTCPKCKILLDELLNLDAIDGLALKVKVPMLEDSEHIRLLLHHFPQGIAGTRGNTILGENL